MRRREVNPNECKSKTDICSCLRPSKGRNQIIWCLSLTVPILIQFGWRVQMFTSLIIYCGQSLWSRFQSVTRDDYKDYDININIYNTNILVYWNFVMFWEMHSLRNQFVFIRNAMKRNWPNNVQVLSALGAVSCWIMFFLLSSCQETRGHLKESLRWGKYFTAVTFLAFVQSRCFSFFSVVLSWFSDLSTNQTILN